jgi:hypothetical protein
MGLIFLTLRGLFTVFRKHAAHLSRFAPGKKPLVHLFDGGAAAACIVLPCEHIPRVTLPLCNEIKK